MGSICAEGAAIAEPDAGRAESKGVSALSISLPQQPVQHVRCRIAIDIGGSLSKLVYFTPNAADSSGAAAAPAGEGSGYGRGNRSPAGGTLHFEKFETSRMDAVIRFIEEKGLLRRDGAGDGSNAHSGNSDGSSGSGRIYATGGGAFKFAAKFQECLGVKLEKGDEMECLVGGCNFLLTSVPREAYTFRSGAHAYIDKANGDAYPYLLVNIGSGVSMLKHERVSGSALGGGTFTGLCRLLTGARTFDDMLALAAKGDNTKVDMLVGDIYGNRDYSKIGLSAETIASSFGKIVSTDKTLEDCEPADIALSLVRMVSYNVAQIAYEVATTHGLRRVLFGGFFIRANGFTMETIEFAINFWSKGQMAATFLRHEGFLGAVGAFIGASA